MDDQLDGSADSESGLGKLVLVDSDEKEEPFIFSQRTRHRVVDDDVPLLDDMNVEDFLVKQDSDEVHPTKKVCAEFQGGCKSNMLQGRLLMCQQFWAILLKRYLCTKHNWRGLFSQVKISSSGV